jgi:DNA-binding NtrC family response regulator
MDRIPGPIMDTLIEYDWPGNVRELRNVLQRYVTLGHLEFLSPQSRFASPPLPVEMDLRAATRQLEQRLISEALHRTGGNRTKAASLLGISRRALFRKLPPP